MVSFLRRKYWLMIGSMDMKTANSEKKTVKKVLRQKTNGLSIAGFSISLVTIFVFSFFGASGILGIVLSVLGRRKAKEEGGKTGLATAGIVLGIINIVMCWAALAADAFFPNLLAP